MQNRLRAMRGLEARLRELLAATDDARGGPERGAEPLVRMLASCKAEFELLRAGGARAESLSSGEHALVEREWTSLRRLNAVALERVERLAAGLAGELAEARDARRRLPLPLSSNDAGGSCNLDG